MTNVLCTIGETLETPCGVYSHDSNVFDEVIKLKHCVRDISTHLQRLQITKAGIVDEADLILCRAGKSYTFRLIFRFHDLFLNFIINSCQGHLFEDE